MLTRPRLLVLDEPTNGLDPAARRQVHRVARRHSRTAVPRSCSPATRMDDLAELWLGGHRPVRRTGRVRRTAGEARERTGTSTTRSAPPTSTAAEPDRRRRDAGHPAADRARPGLARQRRLVVVVRGVVPAVDELVVRLVRAGVGVRELGPVVPPLEAAFLALTADEASEPGAGA